MRTFHKVAGGLALLMIVTFWTSSVAVEVFGSPDQIAQLKATILYAMALLIPAMMVTGITGQIMSPTKVGGVIARKQKRMKFVALLGLFVLLPAAFFLAWKAGNGELDRCFFVVQVVELLAGATNITLLSLNMRDGLRLHRAARPKTPGSDQTFWQES